MKIDLTDSEINILWGFMMASLYNQKEKIGFNQIIRILSKIKRQNSELLNMKELHGF